ncbi:MAG: 1-(5-phosphoribosyl)-5-[(5-phosphoribosylamino)methylideneamino]imidazole-4-carboxamide isomerase [Armatimonadetes bacterium CP1_7O]|jgi:phosphoribosylformimino-5-aminoimidazole carboxamide ribotide isomerase|nr:MAG: 1-(5-phosphoribosyl)-5-[(5-phosphoribosylamino)methylideneamino]imidazole-4-carboxamide isomerase [Armatimonadetes bacterium CP1_7O]RMH10043.1 MAG: 1-(5-phosphoribosyl)-5-[(5-phosphoribosylamino)methylideneamino]imidazole-4-carboxamide isomerase [Armatimonadota bacterium]
MKPFEVIPAIDLRGGYAVRLLQGDYARETRYHDDPIAVAQHWAQRGAPRLHVVDLDGAKAGEPVQLELIARIARAVDIPIQVGGGVRTEAHIQQLLDAGAERVLIGTVAVQNPDFAERMFQTYGERVALALDVKSGAAVTHGWRHVSEMPYLEFARQMAERGVTRIVFTQVERDGTLQGIALEPLVELLKAVAVPVIASGGVRDEADLHALRGLAQATTLEGVIVGKALYEGTLPDTFW